jgi:hypothetical protein
MWLWSQGAPAFIPFGHSPDIDLITVLDDRAVRVQVKSSRYVRNGRWNVVVRTSGGNQSWNGSSSAWTPLDATSSSSLSPMAGGGGFRQTPSAVGLGSCSADGNTRRSKSSPDRRCLA